MSFKDFYLKEKEKLEEEVPTINTTSVGNSSTEGGDANFADKMGPKKKKKKKKKTDDKED